MTSDFEARYRALFETTLDAIMIVDSQGRYVEVNDSMCRLLKAPRERLVGAHFSEFMLPETLETASRHFSRLKSDGFFEGEFPVRAADGSIVELEWTSRAEFVPGLHFCVARDVSARRRAEAALRANELRFRTLTGHAPVGIFLTDAQGNCLFVNERWCEMAGLTPEEAQGEGWVQALHPEDRARVFEEWYSAAETGREFASEYRFQTPAGKVTWLRGSAVAQRDETGRVTEYIGTITDITQHKQAEAVLREEHHRKDEFLAVLAHELRNPLAPIRNALHILRLQGDNPERVEQLRAMMDRQIYHMARIIEDLLEVSRLNRGKISLRREQVDLCQLTRLNAEDHRSAMEAAGLALQLDLPEAPVWVLGDPTRLTQILDNLLENARNFTPAGGAVKLGCRVKGVGCRVSASDPTPLAVVTVSDTGIGIGPEILPRLFQAFAQADRSLDRSRGGLGLGLALVKGLVELHDGTVSVASEGIGHGTQFTLCFPLAAQPPPVCGTPAAAPAIPPRRRVLIIEDNPDSAESLSLLLEATGFGVTVALTGPAGLTAAQHERPDIILCDIGLPGMDGFAVARSLRQHPATAAARLIAVTGYGQAEDVQRSREAGFDRHLTKPVDPEHLLAVLNGDAPAVTET